MLTDLESRNGTRLDGQPVDGPTPLADGQEIHIGDTRLRFRWSTAAARRPRRPGHAGDRGRRPARPRRTSRPTN